MMSLDATRTHTGNEATLYDAVAGRVGYEGYIQEAAPAKDRDTQSTAAKSIPPEEALFRHPGAPVRYEEDDVYAADRHLGSQSLPDSDLLKATHAYASDLYSSSLVEDGSRNVQSLDETALLAMGILLEECAQEVLATSASSDTRESTSGEDSSHASP